MTDTHAYIIVEAKDSRGCLSETNTDYDLGAFESSADTGPSLESCSVGPGDL